MAGLVSIQIDTSGYAEALLRFREFSKKTLREDIRDEARLLGQMLIKLTPPKSQAQGRAAVARDIGYIADGISDEFFYSIQNRYGSHNVQTTHYTEGGGAHIFLDWGELTDDLSRLKQYHRSQRTRRGRINRGSRVQVTPERWTVKNALVVPKAIKERYIKYEQDFVGAARGGWAYGTLALGGKAPSWVSRHATSTFGGYEDATNSERPSFTFRNRSPWADNGGEAQRITRQAVEICTQNLDKRFAAAQAYAAVRAGFAVRTATSVIKAAMDAALS
jgi:hypothetical protein